MKNSGHVGVKNNIRAAFLTLFKDFFFLEQASTEIPNLCEVFAFIHFEL